MRCTSVFIMRRVMMIGCSHTNTQGHPSHSQRLARTVLVVHDDVYIMKLFVYNNITHADALRPYYTPFAGVWCCFYCKNTTLYTTRRYTRIIVANDDDGVNRTRIARNRRSESIVSN